MTIRNSMRRLAKAKAVLNKEAYRAAQIIVDHVIEKVKRDVLGVFQDQVSQPLPVKKPPEMRKRKRKRLGKSRSRRKRST